MVRGRAGRRDRIAHALDLEPGRERRRRGRRHRLRHRERPDALRPLAARDVGRLDDGARRRPARAHDDAGALVRDLGRFEPGIADRLLHGDMVPGGAAAEKAHGAAVDRLAGIEGGRAVHLGAEAELGIFVGAHDARFRFAQRSQHFLRVVADGRDDAHPGDDHPPHLASSASFVRCGQLPDLLEHDLCRKAVAAFRHHAPAPLACGAASRNNPTLRSSAR